jgi:hypothetical protein
MRKTRRNRRQRKTRKRLIGGAVKAASIRIALYKPNNPFLNQTNLIRFLQENPNINAKTIVNDGLPILMHTIYSNDPEMVKQLLNRFNLTDVNSNEDLANTDEQNIGKNKEFLDEQLRYATRYDAQGRIDLRNNPTDIANRKKIISLLMEKGATAYFWPEQGQINPFIAHALGKKADPSAANDAAMFEKTRQSIIDRAHTSQLIDRVDRGLQNKGFGQENPFNSDLVKSNVFNYLTPAPSEYRDNPLTTSENLGFANEDEYATMLRRLGKTYSR